MIARYGLEWDDHMSDLMIEATCFREQLVDPSSVPEGLGAEQHYLNVAQTLWPETWPAEGHESNAGFALHPWERRRIKGLCNPDRRYRFLKWWGPSASGKSTSAAAAALIHFLCAPEQTTVVIVSTTIKALSKRIWAEIERLYAPYDGMLPCKLVPSEHKIVYVDPKTGKASSRFGIFCVGIQNATLKDAIGDLIGVHPPRLILMIDEMQSTKIAAVGSIPNLSTARFFQFIGMGNPSSPFDPLVSYSEPVEGWKLHKQRYPQGLPEWETKYGICQWFDGRTSPAITEPDGDKRYGYLIKQRDFDDAKRWWGENSPQFWSQRRGYVPPEGTVDTVLSEAFVYEHDMMAPVAWPDAYQMMGSLDPSFTKGGDRCMFSPFRAGKVHGSPVVEYMPYEQIYIEPKENETVSGYIARKVREKCVPLGISRRYLAIDCTGAGGGVADAIDMDPAWKDGNERVFRTYFGNSAPEIENAVDDDRKCKKVYYNTVAYLWFMMYHFGRFNQIRGLGMDDCKEFCQRVVVKHNPEQLEAKEDMEGRSPDIADSRAVGLGMLRGRFGWMPGRDAQKTHVRDAGSSLEELKELDDQEESYLHDGL